MNTNLKIARNLLPKQVGDPSIPLADPINEECLVRVIAAIGAITTTALTGSYYHSKEIDDPKLIQFLSKGNGRLVIMSMPDADRTSFQVLREKHWIVLRINVTADKENLWFVELKFIAEGLKYDGLLDQVAFQGVTQKKKVLVISFKYSVAEDSSEEIMKILTDSEQCEPEMLKCLGSNQLDALYKQIELGDYEVVFIVWEWAFDEDQLETFTRVISKKYPELKLIVASNRPGCHRLLREAGCSDELETGTHPQLFPKIVLRQIGIKPKN